MIINSIDLFNKKAVQMQQGKKILIEKDNINELASEFVKYGEICVIDVEKAKNGKSMNFDIIANLIKRYPCRVGGGINSIEYATKLYSLGAKKVIIGSEAIKGFENNFDFLKKLNNKIPKKDIIIAIDVIDNYIAYNGWEKVSKISIENGIKSLQTYCNSFLITDIKKEGMLKGINLDLIRRIKELTSNNLIYAGGVTNKDDIKNLAYNEIDIQIGMSIYSGKLSLADAFISTLKFQNNLIPCITEDEEKNTLMLAYCNPQSLYKTFTTGKVTYYSRSRSKLWTKGETSGNIQKLLKARTDCDNDTILFTVKQKNNACHKKTYSCFGEKPFSIKKLENVLNDRIFGRDFENKKSYTKSLSISQTKKKLMEEAFELTEANSKEEIIWEAADLFYFSLVYILKNKVSFDDVLDKLEQRRKK